MTGSHQPTVDTWSEKDQKIVVTTPPGLMADLTMHAKVDANPDLIWSILTTENPEQVFRGIKAITYREVLEDDGMGRKKLRVGHRNYVKVLFLQVAFDTDLIVVEDRRAGEIHFRNASETYMKFFDGRWTVQPFTQDTLDSVFTEQQAQPTVPAAEQPWWSAPSSFLSRLTSSAVSPEPTSCLVTLEQKILPRHVPPPGIRHVVTRFCAATLRHMMEDLRREVGKQQAAGLVLESASSRSSGGSSSAAAPASITAAALQQQQLGLDSSGLDAWITPITIVIKL